MSAPVALRTTEIPGHALESRQLDAAAPIADRYPEPVSKYFESAGKLYEPAGKLYELADRMWLTEIEDAAALLDLEDSLWLVEIEVHTLRGN
jgi:hypothetical protein